MPTDGEHSDVDVACFRDAAQGLRAALEGWDVHVADPPGILRGWPEEELLPAHTRTTCGWACTLGHPPESIASP